MDNQLPPPNYLAGTPPSNFSQANGPPCPIPVVILPGYAEQMGALSQRLLTAELDNEKLQSQLEQRRLAEEAYTSTMKFADNCICTLSKYGAWVPILNRTVKRAICLISEPPLRSPPFYIIQLSQEKQPVILSEKQFYNDSMLIAKLQGAPGAEVTIRKSVKATAVLLRQAISRSMERLSVSLYAGWFQRTESEFCFTAFSPFSAHLNASYMDSPLSIGPQILPPVSPAAAEVAVKNWIPMFSLIQAPFIQWILTIWFHMASLISLFDCLHFRTPMGMYIFCDAPDCMAYLHRLFCWYGDPSLVLDQPAAKFLDELLARKDQPLVIEDTARTRQAIQNAATVEDMLSSHSLPWKKGRNTQYLPVRALPTVLAATASDLACDSKLITLDLSPEQFRSSLFPGAFPLEAHLEEYLRTFIHYTSGHIPILLAALEEAHNKAWELADHTLSEPCVIMLQVMLGVHQFLTEFYNHSSASAMLDNLPKEDFAIQLVNLLRETSDKQFSGLSDQFVLIARSMIQHKQLVLYMRDKQEKAPNQATAVYVDEDSLYFTSAAFRAVCEKLKQSRPVILKALADAGLVQGHSVNKSTVLTRIQMWSVYGVPELVYVYRLRREAFERLGDPLLAVEDCL